MNAHHTQGGGVRGDDDKDNPNPWPRFTDQGYQFDRLLAHAAGALALCEQLQADNAELRAQLAAAERKLLKREGRQCADPVNAGQEFVRCTQCAELYNADLIGRGGRCFTCRAKVRTTTR
jgi:hypothetical protein